MRITSRLAIFFTMCLLVCTGIHAQESVLRENAALVKKVATRDNLLKSLAPLGSLDLQPPESHFGIKLKALQAVIHAERDEEGSAVRTAIWPLKRKSAIEVSWDNPSEGNQEERQWVQDAVKRTWEAACAVRFVGWQASTPNSRGIRIKIDDTENAPHCVALGKFLDAKQSGMVLNFTFLNWCPDCQFIQGGRKAAIEYIAVHEFGHALGFAHEQNRPDTPEGCKDQHLEQGTAGDIMLTEWDEESIMNYCNPKWNNLGVLSERDKLAAQSLYGKNK
jgi:hypothetical protein